MFFLKLTITGTLTLNQLLCRYTFFCIKSIWTRYKLYSNYCQKMIRLNVWNIYYFYCVVKKLDERKK